MISSTRPPRRALYGWVSPSRDGFSSLFIRSGGLRMKKKRSASSARAKQRAKSARHMPDSALNLSDIPEATDEQLRRARRVGRPVTGSAKQLIAIRIAGYRASYAPGAAQLFVGGLGN